MAPAFDLAVVGAGVVGLGAALAAAEEGLRVVVVEASSEPSGAAARGFGHLSFTLQSGGSAVLAESSRQQWLRLHHEARLDLDCTGTVVVARSAEELDLLAELARLREEKVVLLDADQAAEQSRAVGVIGGAWLPQDLSTDPRTTPSRLREHAETLGVEVRTRTRGIGWRQGRLETSRGTVGAGHVLLAANHDLDQIVPGLAERQALRRRTSQMLRVRLLARDRRVPTQHPVLTGHSLLRESVAAELDGVEAVRERLAAERPRLAALEADLRAVTLPDGTVLLGAVHRRAADAEPFAEEEAAQALLAAVAELFGADQVQVLQRWQGTDAQAPGEILVETLDDAVTAAVVTSGTGMTLGLGLGRSLVRDHVLGASTASGASGAPGVHRTRQAS